MSVLSVAEQMVYEIGDGASYELPDVACDWRNVRLVAQKDGEHRVHVSGARGRPPSSYLKTCATYSDGWQVSLQFDNQ